MSPGIPIAISRRFPVHSFLLGMIFAGVPAPSAAASTPLEQQAAESIDYVAGIVRSADSGTPLAGAMVVVVSTGGGPNSVADLRCPRQCVIVTHSIEHTLGGSMARRVNIMMDDEAWRVIRKLPRGSRSRAVNAAIREWSGTSRRRDASARMDALRARMPAIETDRIVRWIREDRERRVP